MRGEVSLHDALVYSWVPSGNDLEVRAVGGGLPVGYYDVRIRYLGVSDLSVVPGLEGRTIEILYDEFDFADPSRTTIRHSFISSKRREYSIVFGNLDFAIERTTDERHLGFHGMRE
jgi:hypothetical protein